MKRMNERKCGKCKEYKSINNFYKDPYHYKGLSPICKECAFKKQRNEHYRTVWNKNNKDSINKAIRKYQQKYPERQTARNLLHKAVKKGIIQKEPCRICSSITVHAHHPDWSKPLEVIWLCPLHHKDVHFGRISI